jgi:hypothetical protein
MASEPEDHYFNSKLHVIWNDILLFWSK